MKALIPDIVLTSDISVGFPGETTEEFEDTLRVLEDEGEKRAAIEALAKKYAPDDTPEGLDAAIRRDWEPLCMLEMTIDHLAGKEAIELARARKGET